MAKTTIIRNIKESKVSESILFDVSNLLRQYPNHIITTSMLSTYLLYKVSNDLTLDRSYESITSENFPVPKLVSLATREIITESIWDELLTLAETHSYRTEDLAAAVLSDYLYSKNVRVAGEFSTPQSLVKLANGILNIEKDDDVADICSGIGNFIVNSHIAHPDAKYYGYDIHKDSIMLSQMRLDVINADADIKSTNAMSLVEDEKLKFDKIFSHFPFGMKTRSFNLTESEETIISKKFPNIEKASAGEWLLSELVCSLLSENGKAFAILSHGATFNTIDIKTRQSLIERGMIECVISLPSNLLAGTAIPVDIVIFSHGNDKDIKMVDARSMCEESRRRNILTDENINEILKAVNADNDSSIIVDYNTLKENDFALNIDRYNCDVFEYDNTVPFKTVIKEIRRGTPIKANELDKVTAEEPTDTKYLPLASVNSGAIDKDLPYIESNDEKYSRYYLSDGALIIPRMGGAMRMAVAKVEKDEKIVVNGNSFMVELDESQVDPYYLLAYFNSSYGESAINGIASGTAIKAISVKFLETLSIPLPPLDVQKKIGEKYKTVLDEIAILKMKLNRANGKLSEVFRKEMEG